MTKTTTYDLNNGTTVVANLNNEDVVANGPGTLDIKNANHADILDNGAFVDISKNSNGGTAAFGNSVGTVEIGGNFSNETFTGLSAGDRVELDGLTFNGGSYDPATHTLRSPRTARPSMRSA